MKKLFIIYFKYYILTIYNYIIKKLFFIKNKINNKFI